MARRIDIPCTWVVSVPEVGVGAAEGAKQGTETGTGAAGRNRSQDLQIFVWGIIVLNFFANKGKKTNAGNLLFFNWINWKKN